MKRNEMKEAMDILVKHGMFIKFSDIMLYHGRVSKPEEMHEWSVDPEFNNGGDATGNNNVNNIAGLYAGSKQVAEDFARERLAMKHWQAKYTREDVSDLSPEVYEIVSTDPQAVIINRKFDASKLSEKELSEVEKALLTISKFSVTKLAPIKFEDRENYDAVVDKIKSYLAHSGKSLLDVEDIKKIHENIVKTGFNASYQLVYDITSAMNTKRLLQTNKFTASLIGRCFMGSNRATDTSLYEGFPVNSDYIAAWLSNNHVVGLVRDVESGTLGRLVETFALFDLEKINTQKVAGESYQKLIMQYDKINNILSEYKLYSDFVEFLQEANAEEVMQRMKSSKIFDDLYSLDAGVWEGFSVGEHTETTLRIFEDTFEETMPKGTIPFVKLALLAHDIGKGVRGEGSIAQNNRKYAEIFFNSLQVPEEMMHLLMYVIGGSQLCTSRYYVHKDKTALKVLNDECEAVLEQAIGRKPTEEEVSGLANICKIVQTCDSGAYTRYGVTHDKKTGAYYYNGNDRFTRSFEEPKGLSKRKLKLKEPEPQS